MIDRTRLLIADLKNDSHIAHWSSFEELDLDKVWAVRESRKKIRKPNGEIDHVEWIIVVHRKTGLRIDGPKDFGPIHIEVSLPRLLWLKNGRLIKNQMQLDDALNRAETLMQRVAPDARIRLQKICNIELPLHFLGVPPEWVSFYSTVRHPNIEAGPSTYENGKGVDEDDDENEEENHPTSQSAGHCYIRWSAESVTWSGKRLKIKLYDKVSEMGLARAFCRPRSVMRLEFTLLDTMCNGLMTGGRISFDKCYQKFRQLAGAFRSFDQQSGKYDSPMSFIIAMRAAGYIPASEFNRFLSTRSSSARHRDLALMRDMDDVWECIPGAITRLPANHLPEMIDVIDIRGPITDEYVTLVS